MAEDWTKTREELLRDVPDAEEKVAQVERAMRTFERLYELRQKHGLTQAQLAELMQTHQTHVSRIENGQDLYLSTLRTYVEALGGRLEVSAVFGEERINLTEPTLRAVG